MEGDYQLESIHTLDQGAIKKSLDLDVPEFDSSF